MEKAVADYFNKDLLTRAAKLYNIRIDSLLELGSFENYVYEGKREKETVILRLTHISHRTKAEIEAELDWVHYLAKKGAPVCGPIPSINQHYVEEIEVKDSSFFITLFKKASGEKVSLDALTTDEQLIRTWGRTTGLFHRLTKEYITPTHLQPRHDLIEEYEIQFAPFLPNDSLVKEATDAVLAAIKALPKKSHHYGLIHSDLHTGNFLYNGKSIEVFDFDDCAFQHFTHDIAIPLYYSLWQWPLEDQEQILSFSKTFLTHFLNGYEEEYPVYSLSHLPLFLKLRDCELYAVLHKKLDLHSLTKKQQDLLERIRKRIVSKTAIIEIDTEDMMR